MNTACVDAELVPFELARNVLAAASKVMGSESIPLSDALGRVAAEDIVPEEDLVPYARSAMDGYALRAADTVAASSGSPLGLPVIDSVFTGDARSTLTTGTVKGITTGAAVPLTLTRSFRTNEFQ
jgi:molybdopterin molybdotransferase